MFSRVARTASAVLGCCLLASCAPSGDGAPDVASSSPSSERSVPGVRGSDFPVDATPDLSGSREGTTCPYVDSQAVQSATGQLVTGVSVDQRFDPPACVFWSYEADPQATVMVRSMRTNSEAVAVVDAAAPIDSTLKAEQPVGWSGGRSGSAESHPERSGSVYAVWKDETAVVVTTAQPQSVKAQQLAEQTISGLNL